MLLAERVKEGVHGVEHGHHLHGCDVAADSCEAHHITKQDSHVWEHLSKGHIQLVTSSLNISKNPSRCNLRSLGM